MGTEFIDISHAEDGLKDTQHLVEITGQDYDADSVVAEWKPGVREWLVLVCVSLLMAMDAFNATVVLPLVPHLSITIKQPLGGALWIEASYLLASAASQPFFAMLAALFGVGPIVLGAAVLATVGTGVCSGSMNLSCLVAGRFVQGMGCGGVRAVSLEMIDGIIPGVHKIRFFGYVAQTWIIGAMLGLVFGGVLVDHSTWLFYASFVFCALSLLVIPFAVDLRGYRRIPKCKLHDLNWLAAVLTFMGMGCLLIGTSWGGTLYGWSNWHILVLLCAGGVAMVALLLYECMRANRSIFSSAVLYSIPRLMLYTGGLLHGFLLSCHLLNCCLYLILIKTLPPALTGLSLLTIASPALMLLVLTERVRLLRSPRLSPWTIRAGWMCSTLSTVFFIILDSHTPPQVWVFIFLGTGISHALLASGYHRCLHNAPKEIQPSPPRRRNRGSSPSHILVYSILCAWGMCIAVPLSGAILLNRVFGEVREERINHGMHADDAATPGDVEEQLRRMLVDGLQILWRVLMGAAALGGVTSLFVR
ncbi:MFS multidrug transporter [Aspergillus heteromorphus CBS 117.55]|uniref:MFS multidrug transporter n=1 Tax=Aspergillus heteromorphus CBS 117.55 TaxID=1448321 RepID=A0A317W234_9EURO|nr:MFS multidrug transporter [Aspergillus heteromorphus CBS 117.55]PWY79307.1 MFS multidrug transporter [Aspergillus heteromorphus CBS 117.55]